MAQLTVYKPYGAIEVVPGRTYNASNLPASANIVMLQRGVRILDENNAKTPLRGVRMIITPTGVTPAVNPLPPVPFIWHENDELRFDAAFTYEFLDKGIVAHGVAVAV